MGATGAMNRRLMRPDDPRIKQAQELKARTGKSPLMPSFEKDPVGELMDARQGYVARTGRNDLKKVEESGMFKKLTEEQKKKYYRLNPKERPAVDQEYTLGKRSLLGG